MKTPKKPGASRGFGGRNGPPEELTALATLFQADGWTIVSEPDSRGGIRPDLRIERGATRFVVELKLIPKGSSAPLEDLWSRAYLQAKASAAPGERPLGVLQGNRISPSAFVRLTEWALETAPDGAIGVLDDRGLRRFSDPELAGLNNEPDERLRSAGSPVVQKSLFSDLNQWMLKVLLAPELPEEVLTAPRDRYRNASALAKAADCSVMTAHRLIDELRREQLLEDRDGYLTLINREELFSRWASGRSFTISDLRVCLTDAASDVRGVFAPLFAEGRAWFGATTAAAELLGAANPDAHEYVLVDSFGIWADLLQPQSGTPKVRKSRTAEEMQVVIRFTKSPQSVQRAAVQRAGVPYTDVLQAWLDLESQSSADRLLEQIRTRWIRPLITSPTGP